MIALFDAAALGLTHYSRNPLQATSAHEVDPLMHLRMTLIMSKYERRSQSAMDKQKKDYADDEKTVGLERGTVRMYQYSGEWARAYEIEAEKLTNVLDELALDIQHVGSTSIPGLQAKPVIDIAVAVRELSLGEQCIQPLIALGYEYKGAAGIAGRHFFVKGPPENRTHYLHVEELDGKLWFNHIAFRDYLREHPEVRDTYGQLKETLAARFPTDRDAYAAAKDPFVEDVLKKAADTPQWRGGTE